MAAGPPPIVVDMNTIIGFSDVTLADARRLLMFFDLSSARNIQANTTGKLREIHAVFGHLGQLIEGLGAIKKQLRMASLANDNFALFLDQCDNKIAELRAIRQRVEELLADSTPLRLAERIAQNRNRSGGPPEGGRRKTRRKKTLRRRKLRVF